MLISGRQRRWDSPSTDPAPGSAGHSLARVFAAPLVEVLESRGVDFRALFEQASIDPDCLVQPDARIPLDKVDRIWALVWEATRDEAIAIDVAARLHPGSLGAALSFALNFSATLKDMTERMARYVHVLTSAARPRCEVVGGEFQMTVESVEEDLAPLRQIYFFAIMVRLWRNLSRPDVRPIRVMLRGVAAPATPDASKRLRDYFGCEIEYEAVANRIVLSLDEALKPLPAASAELARRGDDVVQEHLAGLICREVTPRVTLEIVNQLSSGDFGKDKVAARLGLGPRTLQRRLVAEGVTFKELLETSRRDLAERYVREGDRRVKEIAYLLGFSDRSNFTRAFRTWFGASPKAFRDACEGHRPADSRPRSHRVARSQISA